MQVYPKTLRLQSCALLDGDTITIEPTIPVRKNELTGEYIKLTFGLPDGLSLKDGACSFELIDRNRIKVKVLPECPFRDDKTRVIVVELNGGNSHFWLHTLPSIWVSLSSY